MSQHESLSPLSRRELLKAGAAAAALAAAAPILNAAESVASAPASQSAASAPASLPASTPLPARALGKTGVKVSVVNLGCGKPPTQRMLDRAYELGIRYFDTAASYGKGKSEEEIGNWFARTGKRKEIFLVTKHDGKPEDLLTNLDARLAALKTDYIDMYFLHGIDKPTVFKDSQFKEVAEKLKKTGKVKFVGFSSHAAGAPACMEAAAQSGFIDGIMMSYNPVTGDKKDEALDKALDACHKAGIGLIAMKTTRGIKPIIDAEKIGDLSIQQAVIKAVLADPRIATVCSAMENFTQLEKNTEVARTLDKPLTSAELEQLHSVIRNAGLAYCPGCESCRTHLAAAHPHAHDITRYLSYFEQDGNRTLARELYGSLPLDARNLSTAALQAARDACAYHVDYPALLARAAQVLA